MRVFHLISGGDTGGAKTHVLSLVDALSDRISVQLVCLTAGQFYREARDTGLAVLLLKQKRRWDLSVVSQLAEMLTEPKADILHCHGARANFLAALVQRQVDIPVVTTLHSDYLRDFEDNLYKHLTYTPLNRLSLRRLDYFIAVTDEFRRMLVERGFDPDRIFTVYNGISFGQMKEPRMPREEFREALGIPADSPVIITVGRLARIKRQDVLVQAAAQISKTHPQVHFLLVGDGPRRGYLQQQVREFDLQSSVHFTGYLDDVESALCASDVAVLTSESESFPYALLEAARRGLPVVSTPVGGIPEMIIHGETGLLVPVGEPAALARALQKLVDSSRMRQQLAKDLHLRTRREFSLRSMRDRHLCIYEKIQKSSRGETRASRPEPTEAKGKSVVISGYFGFGNTGDEALLQGMISSLRERHQNLGITVLSADPQQTEKLHDAEAVDRFSPKALFSALKGADLFLSGGGTLLQDETSLRSLLYYASVIELARLAGARVMLYANGLGPLNTAAGRKAARRCLSIADAVTLRDQQSLKTAEELFAGNLPSGNFIRVTADPAFCLKAASETRVDELFERDSIAADERFAIISLRSWPGAVGRVVRAAAAADRLLCTEGLLPLYLPMQPQFDEEVCQKASRLAQTDSLVLKTPMYPELAMAVMSRADLTVGMRLHALIMSAAAGVPVVGLSYDPKIDGFLEQVGGFCAGSVESLTEDRLTGILKEKLIPDLAGLQQKMQKEACTMRKKAGENSSLALSLLLASNRASD